MNHRPGPGVVAVLASQVRTDERLILAALESRGVRYTQVDTRNSWGYAGGPDPGWTIALNREIGQTRAYYAASALESRGTRVINTASAVELCGDKWRTTLALRQAGLPTPRTSIALTPAAALDAMDATGYPVVIKPLTGWWGCLVARVPDHEAAEAILEYVAALPSPQAHVVYVQELLQNRTGTSVRWWSAARCSARCTAAAVSGARMSRAARSASGASRRRTWRSCPWPPR